MRVLGLCSFILLAALACEGKPVIKFAELSHDFGKQQQNVTLEHIFTFTNEGASTLKIIKVNPG